MKRNSLRRGLAAVLCTAALTGAVGLVASGATAAPASVASKATKVSGPSLTSSDGTVVKAPKGLVSKVHNGFTPRGAARDTPKPTAPGSVIGADSRYQLSSTTSFPSRAIVQIKNGGGQHCTGWMVSANYLLTAGHCVYNTGTASWYNNLTFSPGANGSSTPYGTCGMAARWSFTNYINSGDANYDIGIVKLNCTIGYSTGWFGTWWQSASLDGAYHTIQGYPCDKPFGTQWAASGYLSPSTADRLKYTTDTYNCQSGSPVYQYRSSSAAYCTGYCGMGVHTNGNVGGTNSGTRFTQGKLNAIYALVNQG